MRLAAILAVLAHCVARTAAVNATHVVVGQTVALTGALASTGYRSGVGLRAAFQEANDAGGVESRCTSSPKPSLRSNIVKKWIITARRHTRVSVSYGVCAFLTHLAEMCGSYMPWAGEYHEQQNLKPHAQRLPAPSTT